MITPQAIAMIVFGFIACFMGYSMFKSMLPLWGFFLGGWVGITVLPAVLGGQTDNLLIQGIVFVIAGLIGAIAASPLYFLIVFLSGAILGGLVGVVFGAILDAGGLASVRQVTTVVSMSFPPIPQTGLQYLLLTVFGLITGAASLSFQKFMITASSAFLGAAALITGLTGPINVALNSDMQRGALMLLGWLTLGMVGMIIQFRVMGDV